MGRDNLFIGEKPQKFNGLFALRAFEISQKVNHIALFVGVHVQDHAGGDPKRESCRFKNGLSVCLLASLYTLKLGVGDKLNARLILHAASQLTQ